jgi:PAS domain S-box-containing protein
MTISLETGKSVPGLECFSDRPDGVRDSFIAQTTPLHNDNGQRVGAVCVIVDIAEQRRHEEAVERLAAIVDSSDDAILSQDLNCVITSWNRGAERLFGYAAEEAVGKHADFLIPSDRHDEEPNILDRIRRGGRVDHYETIRQRKDGRRIDVSLTVSPIRDHRGVIVGASKIARDVTERTSAQERQNLLLSELEHRIKNLFALAISVVASSGRSAANVSELVTSARERLSALARAHALTLPHGKRDDSQLSKPAMLHSLIRAIIAPHEDAEGARFALAGCDLEISGAATAELGASASRIRDERRKIWSALHSNGANRNRLRGTRPKRRHHMERARRTHRQTPNGRQWLWRISRSCNGRGPTRRGDIPRLEARRPRHPVVSPARAAHGLNGSIGLD